MVSPASQDQVIAALSIMAKSGQSKFGYDATEGRGRRKSPGSTILNEDEYLKGDLRQKLVLNASDINRNFSLVRWAIARHLDYVTTFKFQSSTGDDVFDDKYEKLVREWSKAKNFDVQGRYNRQKSLRMCEAQRVVKGDVVILKLSDGRLQFIESDRIRNPKDYGALGLQKNQVVDGVVVDKAGRALAFCVWRRLTGGRYEFERVISASKIIHFGYFDQFDQVRGISPLASALNSIRDVYENFDLALAKSKVAQMFGLILTRQALDSAGSVSETAEEGEDCETGKGKKKYDVDFGKGPILLDMDPGEDAKFLENKTPSAEFQSFMTESIGVAIKALDLPFSFYDEAHTNYSGARQARLQYEASAEIKREDNRELLSEWLNWRTALAVVNGELTLPRSFSLDMLRETSEWIAAGQPWIDPVKEKTADIMGISAGIDNPEDVTRKGGGDIYKNIDKRAKVEAYARSKGVVLSYDVSAQAAALALEDADATTSNKSEAR
jgi:lambda family phage portal protein